MPRCQRVNGTSLRTIAAAAWTQAMKARLTRSISVGLVCSAPPMNVCVAMSRVSCLRAQ